ncbi:hypothetical protein TNCV_952811 [Trichonephila clavipes]|nr:hypothetical protein TNCV_952811 [Trichonephila clavipes]
MVSLDGTGCLEGYGVESMLATLLVPKWPLFDCTNQIRDGTPTFCDPLLPTPSNYHIAPTEVAADTSIQKPVSKSVSCSYCRRRGILSLNIFYQNHQIRLDNTALVLMLLNSPHLRN